MWLGEVLKVDSDWIDTGVTMVKGRVESEEQRLTPQREEQDEGNLNSHITNLLQP